MLKQAGTNNAAVLIDPAAFRRLCVETSALMPKMAMTDPAAFRRLCVETNAL